MAFPPLIFCLKTHKSALFVWTGVSSRVVLSIYSPSLALFVYLIRILWLDSFKNEMNEGGCWFVMIKFFKQKYIEKGLTLKLGQSSDEAEMRGGGKVSAPKVHKISICLKSSQERRSRIYHHVRTLLKVLGQHCCCNCGECCKIRPCLKWQMWQFYVLPWVFCELPVPKFQGRKFKFRTNSVNVFPFIPSSRYFKGSKLFPQCKYWLSKPRKRNMPQFWEIQLFFPRPILDTLLKNELKNA